MADRPIIFSVPMIRALMDGRKTQTRRFLRVPRWAFEIDEIGDDGYTLWCVSRESGCIVPALPQYLPHDRLWVREAHSLVGSVDPQWVLYRADGYEAECARHGFDKPYPPEPRWRSPIHMPRWASRLTLTVTEVRVQRLQEISEADAVAEGVGFPRTHHLDCGEIKGVESVFDGTFCANHVDAMRHCWRLLHGPGAWAANPWVAALTFKVHQCNIDALAAMEGQG